MRLRTWRPGVSFRKKLPEVYEFISGIGIFIEEPDVPRKRRDAEDADLHLLAVVIVGERQRTHRGGIDRHGDAARRRVVPGSGRQPHDGAPPASETNAGIYSLPRKSKARTGLFRILRLAASTSVTVTSRRRLSIS